MPSTEDQEILVKVMPCEELNRACTLIRTSGDYGDKKGYALLFGYQFTEISLLCLDGFGTKVKLTDCNFDWNINLWYWVRLRAEGTSIKAKVWNDVSEEPSEWMIDHVDDTYPDGVPGVGFMYDAPIPAYFDSVTVELINAKSISVGDLWVNKAYL